MNIRQLDSESGWCQKGETLFRLQERRSQEEPDSMSLMQRIVPAVQDELLGYVLTVYRVRMTRVYSWLHTWDKRDQWSMIWKQIILDPTRSVRQQLLYAWNSYQVRSTATIAPVRPVSRDLHDGHPVFLVLPVAREDHLGLMVTVHTPQHHYRGTFLLQLRALPTVNYLRCF